MRGKAKRHVSWARYTQAQLYVTLDRSRASEAKVKDGNRHSEKCAGFVHSTGWRWMCICALGHREQYFGPLDNAKELAGNKNLHRQLK